MQQNVVLAALPWRAEPFPKTDRHDEAAAFLTEGYEFGANRFRALLTNAFETHLLGTRVVFLRGEAAARLFYGGDGAFTRVATIPPTTLRLLQDKGSVQQLDGAAHRVRKAMFMSMMTPERVASIDRAFELAFRRAIPSWARQSRIVLHDEIRSVLCSAAATWIGIPPGEDLEKRTAEVAAMVDDAGSFGLGAARALLLRARCERWARSMIAQVRSGSIILDMRLPLAVIAEHRDENGERLPLEVAGVELVNLLRPIVAISRFIVFAAMALHENPDEKAALDDDDEAIARFALEVRRLFPFFPAVGGRATRDLVFGRYAIAKGTLVMLDLYATNHDEASWSKPYAFLPDRFRHRPPTAFDVVPQGGGNHHRDHRCPGEDITMVLTQRAIRLLKDELSYTVPSQAMRLDLAKLPTLPGSGFVMSNVRAR